jgi:hypothetical protein
MSEKGPTKEEQKVLRQVEGRTGILSHTKTAIFS